MFIRAVLGNDFLSWDFSCGNSPRREFTGFLVREPVTTGTNHHGNSRDCLHRKRPLREIFPREPATAGTTHHGNSRDFPSGLFAPKSVRHWISPDVNGPIFLLVLYSLTMNLCKHDTWYMMQASMSAVSTSSRAFELSGNSDNKNGVNQNTSSRYHLVNYSRSQTLTASNLLTVRRRRPST